MKIVSNKIVNNSITSVLQVLSISLVYFFVFRYVIKNIGVKELGIWSLVTSFTYFAQVPNLGISGSVTKYVAKYLALKDNRTVSAIVQTAFVSISLITGIIVAISYPAIKILIMKIVEENFRGLSILILKYSLVSLWLKLNAAVFQSGLEGFQRYDLKNMIIIINAIIFLVTSLYLMRFYGIMGLPVASVIQNFSLFIMNWFALRKVIVYLPAFKYKWDKKIFREILSYGMGLQVNSFIYMFFEPLVKTFLNKFGGLVSVGYFEIANKVISMIYTMLMSAIKVLVPVFSYSFEIDKTLIDRIFRRSYMATFEISFLVFSFFLFNIHIISYIWIGKIENKFIIFSIILIISYFFRLLGVVAETAYLGIGYLRWIIVGNILNAIFFVTIGLILGNFLKGTGVVLGWGVSVIIGSIFKLLSYIYVNKIHKFEYFFRNGLLFGVIILFFLYVIIVIFKEQKFFLLNIISIIFLILSFMNMRKLGILQFMLSLYKEVK